MTAPTQKPTPSAADRAAQRKAADTARQAKARAELDARRQSKAEAARKRDEAEWNRAQARKQARAGGAPAAVGGAQRIGPDGKPLSPTQRISPDGRPLPGAPGAPGQAAPQRQKTKHRLFDSQFVKDANGRLVVRSRYDEVGKVYAPGWGGGFGGRVITVLILIGLGWIALEVLATEVGGVFGGLAGFINGVFENGSLVAGVIVGLWVVVRLLTNRWGFLGAMTRDVAWIARKTLAFFGGGSKQTPKNRWGTRL